MSLPIIKEIGDEIDVTFYLYRPSDVAAYAFVGLFGVAVVGHVGFMFMYRSWHFVPLIIGTILEAFAYYGRAWSHRDIDSIGAWALCSLLMFTAPVLLAATLYMGLSRVVVSLDLAEHAMISPRWQVKIFVLVDVVVFISQIAGIGLQATGDENVMNSAAKAVAAGLAFQLAMLFLFATLAIMVHSKCRALTIQAAASSTMDEKGSDGNGNTGTGSGSGSGFVDLRQKSTRYFVAIYTGTFAIALRSLVRLIEFAQGPTGSIARHEAYQYVFDAVPMFVLVVGFLIAHPGRLMMQSAAYRSMMSTVNL